MIQCIGLECDYLVEEATEQDKATPDALMTFIDGKVKTTLNTCLERYLFKQVTRYPGEDFNQFVSRCKKKS